MKTEVLLFSGGIDSTALLYKLTMEGKHLTLMIVNYGQKYWQQELVAYRKIIGRLKETFPKVKHNELVLDLKVNNGFDGFVPNRNLTLCSLAATTLNADVIYLSGVADDNVVDKNETANQEMSQIISKYCDKEVKIESPFLSTTKGEVVQWFKSKFGGDLLLDTYSCYEGEEEPCYNCEACFRKWVSLESNGISMPYQVTVEIIDSYLPRLHKYHPERIARTLIALKQRYGRITAFDLDGVLCYEGESHEDYLTRRPRKEYIDKINNTLGIKVIYTARLESDRDVTEKWLKIHKVQYDCLFMNKIPYDVFFEDKCVEVKNVKG
jgi:7-cyano-7-deazaguanine synthase